VSRPSDPLASLLLHLRSHFSFSEPLHLLIPIVLSLSVLTRLGTWFPAVVARSRLLAYINRVYDRLSPQSSSRLTPPIIPNPSTYDPFGLSILLSADCAWRGSRHQPWLAVEGLLGPGVICRQTADSLRGRSTHCKVSDRGNPCHARSRPSHTNCLIRKALCAFCRQNGTATNETAMLGRLSARK
jgi:hypothetical protein